MARIHREAHRVDRIGWLRASVLGANDGIVSTASLVLGVAASNTPREAVLIAGVHRGGRLGAGARGAGSRRRGGGTRTGVYLRQARSRTGPRPAGCPATD